MIFSDIPVLIGSVWKMIKQISGKLHTKKTLQILKKSKWLQPHHLVRSRRNHRVRICWSSQYGSSLVQTIMELELAQKAGEIWGAQPSTAPNTRLPCCLQKSAAKTICWKIALVDPGGFVVGLEASNVLIRTTILALQALAFILSGLAWKTSATINETFK